MIRPRCPVRDSNRPPARRRRRGWLAWIVAAAIVGTGCTQPRPAVRHRTTTPSFQPKPRPLPDYEAIYERVHRRFARAAFYKPKEGSMTGREFAMAPLIVQEVVGETPEAAARDRFGAIGKPGQSGSAGDIDRPTVYMASTSVEFRGRIFKQLCYCWVYLAPGTRGSDWSNWTGIKGVVITLDESGKPIIWETWVEPNTRVLFVSSALEAASARQFGEPLPGRRFAVEPSKTEHPDVIVARILDDGPQPMGPFVYLSAGARKVTTLACRCMPSQFDSAVVNEYYDLVPLESLGGTPPENPVLEGRVLRLPDHF